MNDLLRKPDEWTRLIQAEEFKRERNWDPVERWRVIQEMITWAEQQLDPPRNSKEGCLRAAALREMQGRSDD